MKRAADPIVARRRLAAACLLAAGAISLTAATPQKAIFAQPIATDEVLEPSVANEVEHALSRVPRHVRLTDETGTNRLSAALQAVFAGVTNGLSPAATAIRLVSLQRADGRWRTGTNDYTSVAAACLQNLMGQPLDQTTTGNPGK